MKILWLHSVLPWPTTDGNRLRHYSLMREVAKQHDVKLVVPGGLHEVREAEPLRSVCDVEVAPRLAGRGSARLRGLVQRAPSCFVPSELPGMRALAERSEADLVFSSLYVVPAAVGLAVPVVVDDQNVETLLYEQLADRERRPLRKLARALDAQEVRRYERRWVTKAAAVTVCSEQDRDALVALVGAVPISVIPNGFDDRVVQRTGGANSVLFVGGLLYEPNLDAVRFLAGEILPEVWRTRPDIRMVIVGKDPPVEVRALASDRIVVTGGVEDVGPYYSDAAVVVAPLRSGGGTRLKVLEAVAAGVPVVATTKGVEGLPLVDGESALIADDPELLAARIVRILDAPALGTELATKAREQLESYRWEAIGERLVALLESVAAR